MDVTQWTVVGLTYEADEYVDGCIGTRERAIAVGRQLLAEIPTLTRFALWRNDDESPFDRGDYVEEIFRQDTPIA